MATVIGRGLRDPESAEVAAARSSVSWPAIFAGAVTAISISLILLALGSGLGFAAASPWLGAGATATSFAIGTGIWLIVAQWLSSAFGGYIAGRLRSRWVGVHTKEVLFRDTAHGLLAWAVATLIVAAGALGATASAINVTSSAATAAGSATDTLLRSDRMGDGNSAAVHAEITRLLTHEGPLATDDRTYLTQVVARQTGVSQAEAQRRVDTAVTSMRQSADKARKVASSLGFFTALAMVIGAFIAATAAAYAGKLRDDAELTLA